MLATLDIADLPILLAIGASILAGLVSFLSPCIAPLLPGYIAFISGTSAGENAQKALPRAIGFVAGFILLFASLGATAASFSQALGTHQAVIELVSGIVLALLGLAMVFNRALMPANIGALFQKTNSRTKPPTTALAAMPVGAAFAIAWSPCIGPVLAAILTLAANSSSSARGSALLVAYGIGLGIPFLLGAVAIERIGPVARRLRTHARAIQIGSGILLTLLGITIATGTFGKVASRLAQIVPTWIG